ncbi:hypothetical protein GCK72_011974 [Caenorhabditis remanei]|uniref:Serpentine receptor class gamma n=1 Tax=Caenorhabditis remanei TaxID=31234 RepID=A0A6A5GLH3_CAERE|nr:hypothetical protein GCK72_011974 [Caenorhabditis remanei]KAF1755524.1 hypothetical protein GCK72_011974 [Caenorhabditis remanei]
MSAQRTLHKRIRWVYILYGLKESATVYSLFGCISGKCTEEEKWNIEASYTISFYVANCILLCCSLLYLPIVISIRNFSNLPMVQQNQPQKYIYWQTMVTVLFKSVGETRCLEH